ncbi:MAG TPA: PepSY-like domain-containing protein [Chitinophagales bacterium]|nr:PepSY-like domain-containing protein [Chitinophagales bacterium]
MAIFIASDNGTLPQVIVDYIDANYSGISIVDNEQFATTVYKVDLSNNYTLFFEGDGTFIFEDAENDVNISFSALPTAAQNYINSNFAGVPIDQVKKWNNSNHYRVKLDDDEGTRVYFRPSGAHLGTDN